MTGPVQLIVVGFDEPSFTGEVMAELARLREAGVVRVVDVLLVSRADDGTFETLAPPPGSDPGLGSVATELLGEDGTDPTTPTEGSWSLADVVEPGTVAAVALVEHLWADPLVAAIESAGGRALAEGWLTPDDRARLPG
jgi:uncharacterized membrane protein